MIDGMKKGIKKNPVTRKIFDEMIKDGLTEDEAFDVMILVWLNREF
jgi:hypothetical protein